MTFIRPLDVLSSHLVDPLRWMAGGVSAFSIGIGHRTLHYILRTEDKDRKRLEFFLLLDGGLGLDGYHLLAHLPPSRLRTTHARSHIYLSSYAQVIGSLSHLWPLFISSQPSSDVLSVTAALWPSFHSLVLDVAYKELGELPRPRLGLLVLVFDEPPHKIQQHLG